MKHWRIVLTGPNSGIGLALARRFAERGCELVLLGRDADEIGRVVTDLNLRYGIRSESRFFDAADLASHRPLLKDIVGSRGLDGMILCHGYMADQEQAELDWRTAQRSVDVNYTSYVTLLSAAAEHFRQRKRGFLCAVSSVAGDRGRQSNYVYASAKGGLTVYLQGLRNAMHPNNVHVLTVKPGFVDTSMTWGLLKTTSPMVASPDKVSFDIMRAIERRKDVLYTPWFWRWIMAIIGLIPENCFKRLKL